MGLPISKHNDYVNNRKLFLKLPGVMDRLNSMSENLGVPVYEILAVIEKETAGSYSAAQPNLAKEGKYGKARGLIQFYPDSGKDFKTIGGQQYLLSDLEKMSELKQLDVVEAYISEQFKWRDVDNPTTGDFAKAVAIPASLSNEVWEQWKTNNDTDYKAFMKMNPGWSVEDENGERYMTPDTISNFYSNPELFTDIRADVETIQNSPSKVANEDTSTWVQNYLDALKHSCYPIGKNKNSTSDKFLTKFENLAGPLDFPNAEEWIANIENILSSFDYGTNPAVKNLDTLKSKIVNLDVSDINKVSSDNIIKAYKEYLSDDDVKQIENLLKNPKKNGNAIKGEIISQLDKNKNSIIEGHKNILNGKKFGPITLPPIASGGKIWESLSKIWELNKNLSGKEMIKDIYDIITNTHEPLSDEELQKTISLTLDHVIGDFEIPVGVETNESGEIIKEITKTTSELYDLTKDGITVQDGQIIVQPNKKSVIDNLANNLTHELIRNEILLNTTNSPHWEERDTYLREGDPIYGDDGTTTGTLDSTPEDSYWSIYGVEGDWVKTVDMVKDMSLEDLKGKIPQNLYDYFEQKLSEGGDGSILDMIKQQDCFGRQKLEELENAGIISRDDKKLEMMTDDYGLAAGIYVDDTYTDGTPDEYGYTGRVRKVPIEGVEFNPKDPTTWKWQRERVGTVDENTIPAYGEDGTRPHDGRIIPGSESDASNVSLILEIGGLEEHKITTMFHQKKKRLVCLIVLLQH
jgi:hypothetical protein